MNQPLNNNFLNTFFKSLLRDKLVLAAALENLKYNFLPAEEYKEIWRVIKAHAQANEGACIPFAVLEQNITNGHYPMKGNSFRLDCIALVEEVKFGEDAERDALLGAFEDYVKRALFHEGYQQIAKLYNTATFDEAYEFMLERAQEIKGFTLLKKPPQKVFTGYEGRMQKRLETARDPELSKTYFRIPTGIHQLDDVLGGGIEAGAMFLCLGGVNEGKSTFLRQVAQYAALSGFTVMHFQAEDSEHVALTLYDASITGKSYKDMAMSNFSVEELGVSMESVVNLARERGGEIYLDVQGKFGKFTIADCRRKAAELLLKVGQIHLFVFDYFEKFSPSSGKKYPPTVKGEGVRRNDLQEEMKNMVLEFNAALVTGTQSRDIGENKENPNYRKTSKDIGEYKKGHEAFTDAISLNQTSDEHEEGFMKLYKFKGRYTEKEMDIPIYTHFHTHRFYDPQRTLSVLYSEEERARFLYKLNKK